MNEKKWEKLNYYILAFIILGQCIIGFSFYIGSIFYFLANILSVIRVFKLERPQADKVKDVTLLVITISVVIIRIIVYGGR